MTRPLEQDALTVWSAARIVRGHLEAASLRAVDLIRVDLDTVSMEHANPHLAAIAASAARAHSFMHEYRHAGESIGIHRPRRT